MHAQQINKIQYLLHKASFDETGDTRLWLFNRDKSPGQLSTSAVCQDIRHSHFESFTAIC